MDTNTIRAINKLWLPVYPGIAKQIAGHCTKQPWHILEAGCFSGGIGLMLLRQYPQSNPDDCAGDGRAGRDFFFRLAGDA